LPKGHRFIIWIKKNPCSQNPRLTVTDSWYWICCYLLMQHSFVSSLWVCVMLCCRDKMETPSRSMTPRKKILISAYHLQHQLQLQHAAKDHERRFKLEQMIRAHINFSAKHITKRTNQENKINTLFVLRNKNWVLSTKLWIIFSQSLSLSSQIN